MLLELVTRTFLGTSSWRNCTCEAQRTSGTMILFHQVLYDKNFTMNEINFKIDIHLAILMQSADNRNKGDLMHAVYFRYVRPRFLML